MLEEVGFDVDIISLKDYFGNSEKLNSDFSKYNAFFAIGGNSFALRKAMQLSGFDLFIKNNLDNDNFLYAGYSAGICVLAPNMKGLDLVDEPVNPYNSEDVIYEGLGILEYVPVPHYKSDHPESHLVDKVVDFMYENDILFQTLCDGDVFIDERNSKKL
jgi:dipeptidase E